MESLFDKPRLLHPVQTLKSFLLSWKWIRQRAKKGYCDRDLYSVSNWFLDIIPNMLEEIKQNKHGVPVAIFNEAIESFGLNPEEYWDISCETPSDISEQIENLATQKWESIIDQITFLLRESKDDTCTKVNSFEEQFKLINKEFKRKYGEWGEKLQTPEEKEMAKKAGSHRMYFPSDLPEYQEVCKQYFEEEQKIYNYREKCAKEAFELFAKWFYYFSI